MEADVMSEFVMAPEAAVTQHDETYQIFPIGYVRRDEDSIYLEILEDFVPGLKQLDHFGYVQVFWWFHYTQDTEMRRVLANKPPYDEGAPMTGVFASRSPVRPNPIGLTTAKILGIDHEQGRVDILNIDAHDGTPIIDLKAYFPVCDRVEEAKLPEWCVDWPQWLPEEGLGLEE